MNNESLPPLYHRDSKGGVRVWRVWTEGEWVCSEAGAHGGKLTRSRRACEAKNVGRSNATTAAEQARVEAEADWKHKLKRKYSKTIPEVGSKLTLPMLAHPFFDKKTGEATSHAKRLVYPVDVQPKLDGVRAQARRTKGGVRLFSRSGDVFRILHVEQQLERWLPEDLELDGELYVHGTPLQGITSLVSDYRMESLALLYYVFDVPHDQRPWRIRSGHLRTVKESASVKRLDCAVAKSEEDVQALHARFRERGFEGAMVRSLEGVYRYGFRSRDLLKVKAWARDEFVVIGCEEGVGKDEGTATFVCSLPNGGEVKARMRGTLDERRAFWTERESYTGRHLTIEYFQLTEDGVPQFPVGVAFRAHSDL